MYQVLMLSYIQDLIWSSSEVSATIISIEHMGPSKLDIFKNQNRNEGEHFMAKPTVCSETPGDLVA